MNHEPKLPDLQPEDIKAIHDIYARGYEDGLAAGVDVTKGLAKSIRASVHSLQPCTDENVLAVHKIILAIADKINDLAVYLETGAKQIMRETLRKKREQKDPNQ